MEIRSSATAKTAGYAGDLGLSDRGREQAREAAAALSAEAHGALALLHAPSVRARRDGRGARARTWRPPAWTSTARAPSAASRTSRSPPAATCASRPRCSASTPTLRARRRGAAGLAGRPRALPHGARGRRRPDRAVVDHAAARLRAARGRRPPLLAGDRRAPGRCAHRRRRPLGPDARARRPRLRARPRRAGEPRGRRGRTSTATARASTTAATPRRSPFPTSLSPRGGSG